MRKILIVDDDAIYSKVIQKLLCGDYRLVFADNHLDALKLMKINEPDLVIADLNIPGVDSVQLITLIKETLKNKNIPILIISGMDDESLKERLFLLGITEFIIKPIDRNKLKSKIADLLSVNC